MLEKPGKKSAVIVGGLFIGIAVGTPILYAVNFCCCCGFIMLGGLMGFYVYRKEFSDINIPPESSDALIIGIFSGIAGAFIGTSLNVLFYYLFGPVTEKILLKAIEWMQAQSDVPAEYMNRLDTMAQDLKKKMEMTLRLSDVFGGLAFNLIICPIFSMLGGLIGFGMFGKRKLKPPPTISA